MRRKLAVVLVVTLLVAGAAQARSDGRSAKVNHGESGKVGRVHAPANPTRYIYPLKVARNGRYLVDQRDRPFMIVGDSPQAMVGNLTLSDAASFIAEQKTQVSTRFWWTCCARSTPAVGTTGRRSMAFGRSRLRRSFDAQSCVLRTSGRDDPHCGEGAHGAVPGPDRDRQLAGRVAKQRRGEGLDFGRFGREIQQLRNIVWSNGNDFQSWRTSADDALVLAVARGIRSVDKAHLQTVEFDFLESGSLDDPRWRQVIKLDAAYTYYAT